MSLFDGRVDSLPRGVLIDTNILVLLLVGAADREAISRIGRLKRFISDDFDLAIEFIDRFTKLGTTPSILTEASNLLGHLTSPLSERIRGALAEWVHRAEERYEPSRELVLLPHFQKLGLSDCSIAAALTSEFLVLTDDFNLSQSLEGAGWSVMNFNHLRSLRWGGL